MFSLSLTLVLQNSILLTGLSQVVFYLCFCQQFLRLPELVFCGFFFFLSKYRTVLALKSITTLHATT